MNDQPSQSPKRTLLQRLYPFGYCLCPEPDDKITGKGDVVHVEVECVLDWKDRIRVLFSGRWFVVSRVATEHPAGATKANSVGFALPPRR